MTERYLTPEEAADLLRMSEEGLRKMRRERRGLPFYKRGRGILYKLSEIEEFLESSRVEPMR